MKLVVAILVVIASQLAMAQVSRAPFRIVAPTPIWHSYVDTAGVGGDDPYAPRVIRGNYVFCNSAWGHIYVPADSTFFSEYSAWDSVNPSATYSWDYHQYDNDYVKGFPYVGFGYSGMDWASSSVASIPCRLRAIDSLMVTYSVSVQGTENPLHQSMFDIWLGDSVWAAGFRRTWEVMITVLDSSSWTWSWNPVDVQVTIHGMVYDLAVDQSGAWSIAHFRRGSQYPDSTIDLNDFFQALIDEGYVDSTDYLCNVGFGTEPIRGKGTANVTLSMTLGTHTVEEIGGYWVADAEDGGTADFDGVSTTGSGAFSASASADTFGVYGYRSLGDGTSKAMGYKAFSAGSDTIVYMRFYMRLDSTYQSTSTNGNMAIAQLTGTGYAYNVIFLLATGANATTGPFSISLYTATGTAVRFQTLTSSTIYRGVWHRVECKVVKSATNGGFQLWVDGVSIGSVNGLNTSALTFGGAKVGFADDYGSKAPVTGKYIDFDNIKTANTPIGPYVQ